MLVFFLFSCLNIVTAEHQHALEVGEGICNVVSVILALLQLFILGLSTHEHALRLNIGVRIQVNMPHKAVPSIVAILDCNQLSLL